LFKLVSIVFFVIQYPFTGVFSVLFTLDHMGSGGVLWYIIVCKSVSWEGMNHKDYHMKDLLSLCCCTRDGFTPVDSNDNSRVFEETELYDL